MAFTHLTAIQPVDLKTIEGPSGRKYITPEGNQYPSITTVLGAGEKPWLKNWRNMLGEAKADKEMKRAADRGTAVHLMIERFLNNEDESTRGMALEHVAEFNSVRLHLKKINNIYTQESALWSDVLRIAGRVDCIGEFQGKLSIIDFKTSTNDKTDSMIQDYFLQTTAYALMFEERYGIQIEQVVIIMSVERGVMPLVFKQPTEPYFGSLLERINTYHTKHGAQQ
jgi:genome maintenance exonuclease 1